MPFVLLRYGLSSTHRPFRDLPPTPDLRRSYDVVIIGGGGHGLAAAYYLSNHHGIRSVAVLEKGYLAGGNTARNTTTIRSNYLTQPSIRFYKEAVSLYGTMSADLGFNVMFSQRGQLTLAHSEATMRSFHLRAEMGRHAGTRIEVVDPQTVRELCPHLNMDIGGLHEVLGGLWHADGGTARHDAVAWGYAKRAAEKGVEIHQRTTVTAIRTAGERLWTTVRLSVACLIFSVIIGIVGAWAQGAKSRLLRGIVAGYVQFFRNTPPLIQLLFFYFALGQLTPSYSPDGWTEVPIISNVGWAIISLSFFAGAFNIEIFRAGIEAVPNSTREAAESLGMTRLMTYNNVVFPLALRISMPALTANLVNLVKTTNQAYAIAVPELLYQSVSIWNDYPSAQNPTMLLMLVLYLGLVGIGSAGMGTWERGMRIPGYGA